MSAQIRRHGLIWVFAVVALGTVTVAQNVNTRSLLIKGDVVPALSGFGIDGKPLTLTYPSQTRPTVVYVLNVKGGQARGFGKSNEANFAAVVKQAGTRFHFVLVVPEDDGGLVKYVTTAKASWGTTPVTIIANVPDEVRQAYSMFAYPQTIVVSRDGKVLESFQGSYIPTSLSARPELIQGYFGVTLPAAKDR